jgi:hypothetical protein
MTTIYTTAPALHAALLEAAKTAPEDWSEAELTEWHFAGSPGIKSSMRIRHHSVRLLEFADQVRKHPRLFGGGKVQDDKPKKARSTWSANAVRVWLDRLRDGDSVGAMLAGADIGAQYFPGGNGKPFALAAPEPMPGDLATLDRLRVWCRDDGRFVCADRISGRRLGNEYGSRKKAAESAAQLIEQKGAEWLQDVLAKCPTADQKTARADWCDIRGIDDPLPAYVPEPVPVALTVPEPVPVALTVPELVPVALTVPEPVPVALTVPEPVPVALTVPEPVPVALTVPEPVPVALTMPEPVPVALTVPEPVPVTADNTRPARKRRDPARRPDGWRDVRAWTAWRRPDLPPRRVAASGRIARAPPPLGVAASGRDPPIASRRRASPRVALSCARCRAVSRYPLAVSQA